MFTLTQIETAHAKVKSGKDFPTFAETINNLGVHSFETFVEDGSSIYRGENGQEVSTVQRYKPLLIFGISNPNIFLIALKNYQEGNTDFYQFCKECADCGIFKWIVDLDTKKCIYYDAVGNVIFEEKIP